MEAGGGNPTGVSSVKKVNLVHVCGLGIFIIMQQYLSTPLLGLQGVKGVPGWTLACRSAIHLSFPFASVPVVDRWTTFGASEFHRAHCLTLRKLHPAPADTPASTMAMLVGFTVLLDFTLFEEKDGSCVIVSW